MRQPFVLRTFVHGGQPFFLFLFFLVRHELRTLNWLAKIPTENVMIVLLTVNLAEVCVCTIVKK